MQAVDNALLDWLLQPAQASAAILAILRALTALGAWWATLGIAAAVAIYLLGRGESRRAAALLVVVLTGRASVEILKQWTDRARPALTDFDVSVHSASFPSGHAANSTITFLAVALVLGPFLGAGRSALVAAAVLAGLIGLTRPMLGVHWPSDVLAGWSWGVAWTLGAFAVLNPWISGRPTARPPRSD